MKKVITLSTFLFLASFFASASDGLIKYESQYAVKETADRFENILKSKGLTLFARVNHQKNAQDVNLDLRATEVIIFGNPKVGTPLMQCTQDVAIDLPQKVMVSEDENKKVWLTYNNPNYLMQRHDIQGCDEVISKISDVLTKLSNAAVAM
ncbi:DUF302 domain-containing protein [Alteromonas sp. 345S023]|uniref:DUF302 domain-containing protein n=1 Tax=Alteromonas profundi TaxID=2696062 RepID=A0A7X5LNU9_9ALTE|nr:DUF302 domain-containing protein [Alteromonas profundi]NDV92743.1 DUF302 domain-containing protein [Alteromonas profundi]